MIPEIYNALPSFFKTSFADSEDRPYLNPILDLYEMAAKDTLQRMRDINNIFDIDRCPNILKERYKSFEFGRPMDEPLYRYPLSDQNIIHIDELYLDTEFRNRLEEEFQIGYDSLEETRFIEFSKEQKGRLYAKEVYVDTYPVIEFYGKLLGYSPIISYRPNDVFDNIYYIDFAGIKNQLDEARREIFALLRARMAGTTVGGLTNFLSAVLGCPMSPVEGVVTDADGEAGVITIDAEGGAAKLDDFMEVNPGFRLVKEGGTVVQIGGLTSINAGIRVGDRIKKYEPLSEVPVHVYDFYSNPARFIQTLLADGARILVGLMDVRTDLGEKYAALFWDSGLSWDTGRYEISYDMGNPAIVTDVGSIRTNYALPVKGGPLKNVFADFADSRFTSPHPTYSIAEVFAGVTVVEVIGGCAGRGGDAGVWDGVCANSRDCEACKGCRLKKFLPMVKQGFTKFVIVPSVL